MLGETKEQVLESIIDMDKPHCPHCEQVMKIWEVPPIPMGDGLGWGTPFMFVCFNDECRIFKDGWENMSENYGHHASYRCICYPGTENFEIMPVFGNIGAKAQVVDDQAMVAQEILKEAMKRGFSILAECYVTKDSPTALNVLFDSGEPHRVRAKAAEIAGDIGEPEAAEMMANARFANRIVREKVEEAIQKIHERHFTRECPFCAEIIKKRARFCKHCQREVAGS